MITWVSEGLPIVSILNTFTYLQTFSLRNVFSQVPVCEGFLLFLQCTNAFIYIPFFSFIEQKKSCL